MSRNQTLNNSVENATSKYAELDGRFIPFPMHYDAYAWKHTVHIIYRGYYLHMYAYIQYIWILCINIHKVEYVYYACTMYTHSYTPDA